MKKFKVGDKLRCIDDDDIGNPPMLVKGEIYTFRGNAGLKGKGKPCIFIKERMKNEHFFYETRFELVEEIIDSPVNKKIAGIGWGFE